MKCDFCSNDANIELAMIINGETKKIHLCSRCYKERVTEMMDQLPEILKDEAMGEQIRELLKNTDPGSASMQLFSNETDGKEPGEFFSGGDITEGKKEPSKSAREYAFEQQRQQLKKKQMELSLRMQEALSAENYELCAQLRDEIEHVGDQLILLNDERKNPYGV